MCLTAFSLHEDSRHALLLAANRDEWFAREAEPLHWWPETHVLGGRDLQAGGAWMLLDRLGHLALVTNVREPGREQAGLASRGDLPLQALAGAELAALATEARNGFNLLHLDLRAGRGQWVSNRPQMQSLDFGPGHHGLSNAALDTPWPKLRRLQQRLRAALDLEAPDEALFAALADAEPAPDAELPSTGLSLERERTLSSAFIRVVDAEGRAVYGTRCSTVVVAERMARGLRIRVRERRFAPDGSLAGENEERFSAG